jgi:predicted PurR-regulated permease PerM
MMQSNKRWPFWLMTTLLLLVFIYLIRSILLPFVLGIFIAYFLNPAADRLERAGLSRNSAALLLMGAFFSTLIVMSIIVIPVIANQFAGLIQSLPGYFSQIDEKYTPMLSDYVGGLSKGQMASVKQAVSNFSGEMVTFAGQFATGLLYSGMAVVHLLSLILITPVVAFYLLRDWGQLLLRLDVLLPRTHAVVIRQQLVIIDRTLSGFIRGQINVCLIMSVFYALALSLAGLKFGIVIGLATGILVVFPYVGLLLSTTIGMGVAFFQFPDAAHIGIVLAVFVVGGVVEGYLITPRLVGEKVGLHPVWIIFGMLSGGALFGLVGVLLAVPVTAVIGVLIRFGMERYLQSEYYRSDNTVLLPEA